MRTSSIIRKFASLVVLLTAVSLGVPSIVHAASNVAYFAVYCSTGGGLSTSYAKDNILTCHNSGAKPLFEANVASLTTDPNGAHFVTIVEADCYPDTSQVPTVPATPTDHVDCGKGPHATLTLGSTFPPNPHPAPAPAPSSPTQAPVNPGTLPKVDTTNNSGTLPTILGIAFGIAGALALLMITVSGLRYILSGGNPEKTAKAKNGLIYALIGLVIAVSAEAIVAFVGNRL